MRLDRFPAVWLMALLAIAPTVAMAQQAPEIGYMYPPGGQAGTTFDVVLGGYDWTPDMQIFVGDTRVKLEVTGPPGPVLVDEPPYWFGKKARGPAFPQAREIPGKLTIPADVPPGVVRWQVANANGISAAGQFQVTDSPDLKEDRKLRTAQPLPNLPVSVVGQIHKIEQVDRYRFSVPQAGLVTCELFARRFSSPLNGWLEIRDSAGTLVANAADTEGLDTRITFPAQAGMDYTLSLHDVDFRGTWAYTYRLVITTGPRIEAALPSTGRRGETRDVTFLGYGLATGANQLETVVRPVTFPADPQATSVTYRLETPFGVAQPYTLLVSDLPETVEPASTDPAQRRLTPPCALTGTLAQLYGEDRYTLEAKKGDVWSIAALSNGIGSPLDVSLGVIGPDGKELMRNDDVPGTTDANLQFTFPEDGVYTLIVSDISGKSGRPTSTYRLTLTAPRLDFTVSAPALLSIPLGGKASLPVKIVRGGGFNEPVKIAFNGLPAGMTVPAELIIPMGKSDLAVEVNVAADAAALASPVSITASGAVAGAEVTRAAGPLLMASIMAPVCKVTPEGLDDVRKNPRGATYPAPVLIERMPGFTGEITLEMAAKQERHRQGVRGPDFIVPADATRVLYPVFLPEILETTKTSRIVVNGVARVPDPKGNVRYLVTRMNLRIGFLPEGALLKIAHEPLEYVVPAGQVLEIPVSVTRTAELLEPAQVELVVPKELQGLLTAEPITLTAAQQDAVVRVQSQAGTAIAGEHTLMIRATALREGKYAVISETEVRVEFTVPK